MFHNSPDVTHRPLQQLLPGQDVGPVPPLSVHLGSELNSWKNKYDGKKIMHFDSCFQILSPAFTP